MIAVKPRRERWTALVSGLALLVLAGVLASVRLPFVVWSPGPLLDLYGTADGRPVLTVSGVPVYPVSGQLQVAGVAVTTKTVSLGRGLTAFYAPDQAVLPQAVNYPYGEPIAQVAVGQNAQETQRAAEAAALRQAGLPVERAPRVVSVISSGASSGWLLPGDVIEAVGSTTVTSVAEFNQAVALHSVGETILLTVTRDGKRLDNQVDIVAQAANDGQQTPSLGVTMTDSFLLGKVDVQGAPSDVGSSLLLALAIYDLVTDGPLLNGLSVAGTGVIDASGIVSGVAGTGERLQAAQKAGAQVFLLPRSNCANIPSGSWTMTIVAVASLPEAITSLQILAAGGSAGQVPTCPV